MVCPTTIWPEAGVSWARSEGKRSSETDKDENSGVFHDKLIISVAEMPHHACHRARGNVWVRAKSHL